MHRIAHVRRGVIAGLALLVTFISGGLVSADLYPSDLGPQLATDRNVVQRGHAVTVYLNTFPAGQHIVLNVRPTLSADQNPVIASADPVREKTRIASATSANVSPSSLRP